MSNSSSLSAKEQKRLEPILDKKKIDAYYTMVLQKRFKTGDVPTLEKAAQAKGVHMRIISTQGLNGYDNYITISDKSNKILGQLPAKLFFKK